MRALTAESILCMWVIGRTEAGRSGVEPFSAKSLFIAYVLIIYYEVCAKESTDVDKYSKA